MNPRGAALAVVAVVLFVAAGALSLQASAGETLVAGVNRGGPSVARPAVLRIDAGAIVRGIRWRSWNGASAAGSGTYVAAATAGRGQVRIPALLTFSNRAGCRGKRAYTRLTLQLARTGPGGARALRLRAFTNCATSSFTPGDGVSVGPGLAPPSQRPRGCFEHPSACGYPDETNSGPAPGTPLTPAGEAALPPGASWDPAHQQLTITRKGTVIAGLDITGTVVVNASGVTISTTRIVSPAGGFGVVIPGGSGAKGTRLEAVSVGGAPGAPSTAAVNNRGSNDLTIQGSLLHDCTECFQNQARSGGTTTIIDSHIRTSDPVQGCDDACPHYEAVYASGNAGAMRLVHNTLLNPIDQTAVVYIDAGRHDDLTVTENLIAGGGYSIYAGVQSERQVITDNRFSNAFQTSGMDTFTGGRWPTPRVCVARRSSGCFGILTAAPADAQLRWSGNFWDDTLRAVRY